MKRNKLKYLLVLTVITITMTISQAPVAFAAAEAGDGGAQSVAAAEAEAGDDADASAAEQADVAQPEAGDIATADENAAGNAVSEGEPAFGEGAGDLTDADAEGLEAGEDEIVFAAAEAAEYGDFMVDGGTASFEGGVLTVSGDATITMKEGVTQTSQRIVIAGDGAVTVSGLNINASGGPAIRVNPDVKTELKLDGENTVTGAGGYAGVEVGYESAEQFADLTISGDGTLNANGGSNSAGIGGSKSGKGVPGNITIKSGTINAVAGGSAAAIGTSDNPNNGTSSGSYKHTTDPWGTITIDGGTVNATANGSGAGIGGGNHCDSGKIVINDGTVTAQGHAGIGCGIGSSKQDNSGQKGPGYYFADVEINGGTVTATANKGANGAGIGGGMYSDAIVKITGGNITATGNYQNDNYHHGGAGIGGGYEGHALIEITGGTINASGGGAAAGIGSGAAPNSNPDRGKNGRSNDVLEGTTVTISGGDVTADAGQKGGAGIGGGTGADKVSVNISGGTVKAYGSKSSEDAMYGGAGIGSGTYGPSTGESAKYFSEADVDISITGGEVLAIGGWGAAGIGSGADNKMANEITLSDEADIEAYSDGTKFAIDTRILKEDESTESRTDGRSVDGDILQGTFVHKGEINGENQDTEGLSTIKLTNESGDNSRILTRMPEGYRSFAATVKEPGTYTVYSDDEGISGGAGRYFSVCTRDVWEKQYETDEHILYDVTSTALSDQFYLYPVDKVPPEPEPEPDDKDKDKDKSKDRGKAGDGKSAGTNGKNKNKKSGSGFGIGHGSDGSSGNGSGSGSGSGTATGDPADPAAAAALMLLALGAGTTIVVRRRQE